MTLRQLYAVLAVFQQGSALRAAPAVHLSQPAVAGAVAACEAELARPLFDRGPRGMVPTAAGRLLCARIACAFDHLKSAEAQLHQRRATRGPRILLHRLVTLSQLRALSAVIDSGSFSAAARRLGLSQPSVHRAARELELLCGVSLWRRDGGAIEPSADARLLARYADLALAEIALGRAELTELDGRIEGTLTVGALPLARSKWLPRAVAMTLAHHPKARIRIIDGPYDEQLNALLHGKLDMILGALRDPVPSPDIIQETVFVDPLVIVVRADHDLARQDTGDGPNRDQLARLSWILPRPETPARRNFAAFLDARRIDLQGGVIECSSLVATCALLMQTDHAALLSRQQIERDVALRQLRILGPPLPGTDRPIGIAQRRGFRSTRLHAEFRANVLRSAGEVSALPITDPS